MRNRLIEEIGKTAEIIELPPHHSGVHMGYMAQSRVLPNTCRTFDTLHEAREHAEYLDKAAMSRIEK